MLMIIGSVLLLVAAVLGLVILIGAFKESAAQGLLCMFVPFYMFYYAFARYKSSKKGLVVGGWATALVLGATLQIVGGVMAANEAVADFNADMQQLELDLANPPADLGATGEEAPAAGTTYTCNEIATNKLCYTVSPPPALLAGNEAGCMGEWTQGENCPAEGVAATCEKDRFNEVRRFYEGVDMANAETACTTFGGTFSPGS